MRERAKMVKIPKAQLAAGGDIWLAGCGVGETFTCGPTVNFA